MDDGAAHLEGGLEDDGRGRSLAPLVTGVAQPSQDVLDVDDGVVDDLAEGDDQAGQDHGVDGGPCGVQDQQCRGQRQRHRHEADQGDAPLVQEQDDDHDHQQKADQHRHPQIVDRIVDEGRRAEDRRVEVDARQTRFERLDGGVDALSHLERVAPRQLLDDQQQSGAAVDHGVADDRLVVGDHPAYVAQPHRARRRGLLFERHLGELPGCADRHHVDDLQTLVGGLQKAAGADHGAGGELQRARVESIGGRALDVVERDVQRRHLRRVDLDLERGLPFVPERHVGHAVDAQQARLDRPVGEPRQLHYRVAVRPHADLQDPPGRRDRRQHDRRTRPLRQRRPHRGEPLLHELPGVQQIGARLEDEQDRGELGHRRGAHVGEARHAVHGQLERHGHQRLDVGRGQPQALGLDLDLGWREVRKHVDRRIADGGKADGHHGDRGADHQEPEVQAPRDDRPHRRSARHGHSSPTPYSAPSSSDAPTITTGVPTGGPDRSRTVSPEMRSITIALRT